MDLSKEILIYHFTKEEIDAMDEMQEYVRRWCCKQYFSSGKYCLIKDKKGLP